MGYHYDDHVADWGTRDVNGMFDEQDKARRQEEVMNLLEARYQGIPGNSDFIFSEIKKDGSLIFSLISPVPFSTHGFVKNGVLYCTLMVPTPFAHDFKVKDIFKYFEIKKLAYAMKIASFELKWNK
ncbi:hypothetical protein UFOVP1361_22 [uncultured Caudovirales phage]|uniref:Uncharacterized protein n=1 Tax=uncultured Caudovirales phage TaxID=2100421 RepID=A0A6J5S1Q4_9CAUD|nr:hypothetical protein UFOVP1361_22 [uncultured Caudovirales phage]